MKTSTLLVFCAALLTSTPIAAPSPQGSTGFQTLLEFDDANFNDLYDLEAPADGTIFTITNPAVVSIIQNLEGDHENCTFYGADGTPTTLVSVLEFTARVQPTPQPIVSGTCLIY